MTYRTIIVIVHFTNYLSTYYGNIYFLYKMLQKGTSLISYFDTSLEINY